MSLTSSEISEDLPSHSSPSLDAFVSGALIDDPHLGRPLPETPENQLVPSESATPMNDPHLTPSPDMSIVATTRGASTPRLPIELCERIMDFFMYLPNPDGFPHNDLTSLAAFALFSRQHLLSFTAFLSSRPDLCTRVVHINLWGYSDSGSTERQDDSWVSSAPLMLPALPNLKSLRFRDINFSHQHAIFDKAFAKFKHTSNIESVHFKEYRDVSSITFARFIRLTHVLGAEDIQFETCTFNDDVSDRLGAVPRNIRPTNWWHEHLWSRIHQTFCYVVSVPKTLIPDWITLNKSFRGAFIIVDLGGHEIELFEYSAGPRLLLWATAASKFASINASPKFAATTEAILSTWSNALYALRSCTFKRITLNLQSFGIAWNWDEHTPNTWKAVDNVLSQYYPDLQRLDVTLPKFDPYPPPDHVLSSRYGCVDLIQGSLLPIMWQKNVVRWRCHDEDCRCFTSAPWDTLRKTPTSLPTISSIWDMSEWSVCSFPALKDITAITYDTPSYLTNQYDNTYDAPLQPTHTPILERLT
ncbi:hypothetical protein EUX98_g6090 [Antrodiella citrinella]|uniref:Uncharacterized protein n=1 Tax=Antrodiella citrinella TaxID=2447956 RepID=A0A4S4MRS2_9APHY|nr:hypothetical protein EUX98_g6090 [Antrodiella citrinella]